ncbi:MAG: carbamoyltransferase HypF [Desulfovibrio sp.]|jgi:hydrogenase maturation protein HypF|nr:carbamoyltransferase HypF [Desulfovibrio sp.]
MVDSSRIIRRSFTVEGQVQGVGFRPFVYRLADEEGLTGFVGNTSEGVRIEVQGGAAGAERFEKRLLTQHPPLARIVSLSSRDVPPEVRETAFVIRRSRGQAGHNVLVSPDVGICADCRQDMRDPANPRFAYPFANCANCGPRYSITRAIPYDRASTTMACFPLCPDCAAEYDNPADRRFHAQPIACPVCGPRLWFVPGGSPESLPDGENGNNALGRACRVLLEGGILALKGLGGFQLACDARREISVRELRRRKFRPHKPLALMVADVEAARALCLLGPEHEALLQSPENPVVLCPRLPWNEDAPLCRELAPDTENLGLMLPYTPLHVALFDALSALAPLPPALVMTSANPRGEPLCLTNREALARLAGMADAFLLHDRDILTRVDDSVISLVCAPDEKALQPLFFRRARGYVPRPVFLPSRGPNVLGAGAELKSTMCLTHGDKAFVGQHIGDLENPATLRFYEEVVARLENLLEIRPQALVCDLHPDFLASRYAHERAAADGLPLWELQHHAAHAAAVLAENGWHEPALALCLDGAGLGDDGLIWGGELILMDIGGAFWRRVGSLSPFPLPGGEAAIREPWRCAAALRAQCGSSDADFPGAASRTGERTRAERAVREMLAANVNCPLTSSCGRLFDAVSAQLGLCQTTSYEGQAAVRLEAAAVRRPTGCLDAPRWDVQPGERDGLLVLDCARLFADVLEAQRAGDCVEDIAARFHVSLAWGFAEMAYLAASRLNVRKVGLSGGVMQNGIMAALLPRCLKSFGLEPLTHHELPPGDGGLSLGQAVWGRALLRNGN